MRARYPSLQVISDNEEALKHVLKDACGQVHLEYSNTRLETPASNGQGENSVRTMKEMVQRHKDAVFSLEIVFHQTSSFRVVEVDNHVIQTSP